jgi:hypothetical protein
MKMNIALLERSRIRGTKAIFRNDEETDFLFGLVDYSHVFERSATSNGGHIAPPNDTVGIPWPRDLDCV